MSSVFDVVVIGAGPIGLYATYTCGEKRLKTALVDALPEVGGQLTALYPKKYIFDVAGYPGVTAETLVAQLKLQARQFEPTIELNFKVVGLERQPGGEYRVTSEDGRSLSARYIILASGAGVINPRRLDLAESDSYLNRGLEYVVRDIESYRNRRVLVVGGGDTALDWANYFTEISAQTTLIHRTARFSGFEGSLKKLEESPTTILTHTVLSGVSGDDKVERVQLTNKKESWTRELAIDQILVCIGFAPRLGFLKEGDFEIAEGSVRADSRMRTNIENVYAVGDISNHPGRIRLISTGFGNVRTAVLDISESHRT